MPGPVGPLSPKQAPGRVARVAPTRPFAQSLREARVDDASTQAPPKPEAPKLESLLIARFLKESKLVPDGDARAPLLNQILADHLIEGGDLDLDLGAELR